MNYTGFIDCSIPEDGDPAPRLMRRRVYRCSNRTCGRSDCETCKPSEAITDAEILRDIDEETENIG